MNKIKIEFEVPEKITVDYREHKIELTPFLSMGEQVFLISKYIEDYFEIKENPLIPLTEYNYVEAESNMMNYICQILTNIDRDSIPNDVYVDPQFYKAITANIENYGIFRYKLENIMGQIKEKIALENSLGKTISNLGEKLFDVLEKFSEMTPEDLEKIQNTGIELLERLEKSSVLGTPIEES